MKNFAQALISSYQIEEILSRMSSLLEKMETMEDERDNVMTEKETVERKVI